MASDVVELAESLRPLQESSLAARPAGVTPPGNEVEEQGAAVGIRGPGNGAVNPRDKGTPLPGSVALRTQGRKPFLDRDHLSSGP